MGADKKRFQWGFGSAALAIAVLALWVQLCATLVARTRAADGGGRWLWPLCFFFAVLPMLAVAVYRWPLVFDFFRSVKVGVMNLIFIGMGAIFGVLWHQEDPNAPLDRQGMEQLEHWQDLGGNWPPEVQAAYTQYAGGGARGEAGFRNAHAFFLYQMLHGLGFHLLPGVQHACQVDEHAIDEQMDRLEQRMPELRARFGEEFAVGLRAGSRRGLETRAENGEIAQFEHDWDDFFWTLFVWSDRLDLIRVYRSDWYAALWGILFFGVLSNTFRGGWRRLLRPSKWGFVLAHTGVMSLILGGLIGRLMEERGMVELHVGQTAAGFQLYSGGQVPFSERSFYGGRGQPFALRLDGFRADYFDVLDIGYARVEASGEASFEFPLEQPKVRVYRGQKLNYDYGPASATDHRTVPWLRLEVVAYYPKARIETSLHAAEAGDQGLPLARVAVDGAGDDVEQILTPLFDVPLVHGPSGVRVRLDQAEDEEQARSLLDQPVPQRMGQLMVAQGEAGGADAVFDVYPGARRTVTVAGAEYQLEVLQALPRLLLEPDSAQPAPDNQAPELESPDNPAVQVRIRNAAGEQEDRWVLEQEFHPREQRFPEVQLQFLWDRWAGPATARWVVFQLPDGSLRYGRAGEPASLQPLAVGERRGLGAVELVVQEAYLHGTLERVPKPLESRDFFLDARPAVRVRAVTPQWSKDLVLTGDMLAGRDGAGWELLGRYDGPDGKERTVFLRLREDVDDLPVEWRSRLTVQHLAGAQPADVRSGEIRVNDYLRYGGYRFFQTNARPNDPTYSGIGVVYDPGIEPVLLGLYIVAGGTIVVFWIRPLLTRRRKADQEE